MCILSLFGFIHTFQLSIIVHRHYNSNKSCQLLLFLDGPLLFSSWRVGHQATFFCTTWEGIEVFIFEVWEAVSFSELPSVHSAHQSMGSPFAGGHSICPFQRVGKSSIGTMESFSFSSKVWEAASLAQSYHTLQSMGSLFCWRGIHLSTPVM